MKRMMTIGLVIALFLLTAGLIADAKAGDIEMAPPDHRVIYTDPGPEIEAVRTTMTIIHREPEPEFEVYMPLHEAHVGGGADLEAYVPPLEAGTTLHIPEGADDPSVDSDEGSGESSDEEGDLDETDSDEGGEDTSYSNPDDLTLSTDGLSQEEFMRTLNAGADDGAACSMVSAASANPLMFLLISAAFVPLAIRRKR